VRHQHKKEAIASFSIILVFIGLIFAYFFSSHVRFAMHDAYNSIIKIVITDRVLREEAEIYSNLSYCNSNNPRQTLDLYVPQHALRHPMNLVIFIHGGGWKAGDKSGQIMTYYSEELLKNGVAVASLNYRLYPEVTYPKPNEDIACAIRYLSDNAPNYDIAKSGWTVFGDSAGAQLGAYAMGDSSINAPLKTFVGFYGPYDLREQITRIPRRDVDAWNYTNKGNDARNASPFLRPIKKDAKYVLYHGEKDRTVYMSQSQKFSQRLIAENVDTTFTQVKNANHYFSPRTTPTSTAIKKMIITSLTK
jgi:acetyl esterase/lipase